MAAEKRDRVQEIRDRLAVIADQDTRIIRAANRFADFSVAELEGLLQMPADKFPMHGFRSKKEVRIALYANVPKKAVPYGLLAAHERTGYFIRKEEPQRAAGMIGLVVLPAPLPPAPDQAMIVRARDARGQLIDVEAAPALPPEGDDGAAPG